MSQEPSPEQAAPAEGTLVETDGPSKSPEDPPTAKHDLRKLLPRLQKRRRRHSQGELAFKRKGKKKEVRIFLDRSSTVIGRDEHCDVVLDEPVVSRRHARVVKNERGFFELIDLSSSNGTLVEGVGVSRMLLCDGDRFTIGETRFTVFIREEEAG